MNFLFGSKDKRTPYEKARDQQEKRQLDRQINQSDREIQRLSNEKCVMFDFGFFRRIKHDKTHLYAAKANLDTIKSQLTNVRLTGVMQTSSEIARSLSELMKIEQFQSVLRQFNEESVSYPGFGLREGKVTLRQLSTVVASDQPVLHDDEDITARLQALKE